nr:hypothetical protein [Pseudomonas frederiksbergensis]
MSLKQPDLLQAEQRSWQFFSLLALSDAGETLFDELKLLVELDRALFQSFQRRLVLLLHLFWRLGESGKLALPPRDITVQVGKTFDA